MKFKLNINTKIVWYAYARSPRILVNIIKYWQFDFGVDDEYETQTVASKKSII